MIVREGSKYVVKSEDGKRLGAYDTRAAAEKRLQQIHYWKHRESQRSAHRSRRGH